MSFIPKSELERLRRAARNDEDIKKLEKSFRKQINKERNAHAEAIEDLEDAKDREIHILQRQLDKADVVREDEVEALHVEYKKQIEDLETTVEDLNAKIVVLETRVSSEAEITKRELDVEDEEDELERVTEFLAKREKDFEKKVKEFDARVKDENEAQYKSGYTDGVSDTLREAQTLAETGNERTYKLAEKALDRETTVIATTTAPNKSK